MAALGTDVRTGKSNIPASDVDRKNTARIKQIIEKIGWPRINLGYIFCGQWKLISKCSAVN